MLTNIIFISLLLAYYNLYINRGVISTSLIYIKQDLNLDWLHQSYITSSFLIGYILFCFIASCTSSKINNCKMLGLGSFIWIIGNCMCIPNNIIALYVSRFLAGVGDGIFQALMPLIVRTYFQNPKTKLSILYSVINFGTASGNLLGGIIKNWRSIILSQNIIMIMFIPSILHIFKSYEFKNNEISVFKTILIIFKNLDWWINLFGYLLINYSISVIFLWTPTFLNETYIEIAYTSLVTYFSIIFLLGSLPIPLIIPKVLSKLGLTTYKLKKYSFITCSICCILMYSTIIISIMTNNFILFGIMYFLFIFFYSMSMTAYSLLILELVDNDHQSVSMSLAIGISNLFGSVLSPIICSFLIETLDSLSRSIIISSSSLIIASFLFGFGAIKQKNYNILE